MLRRFARTALGLLVALLAAAPAGADPVPGVMVAVLARPVQRGELLSPGDFAREEKPVAASRGALEPEDAAGMEARRPLAPGSVVRLTDIMPPRLVRRGEPVLIAWRSGRIAITTQGRALRDASVGDLVRVVASSTQRTLDGIVAPDGTVLVGY